MSDSMKHATHVQTNRSLLILQLLLCQILNSLYVGLCPHITQDGIIRKGRVVDTIRRLVVSSFFRSHQSVPHGQDRHAILEHGHILLAGRGADLLLIRRNRRYNSLQARRRSEHFGDERVQALAHILVVQHGDDIALLGERQEIQGTRLLQLVLLVLFLLTSDYRSEAEVQGGQAQVEGCDKAIVRRLVGLLRFTLLKKHHLAPEEVREGVLPRLLLAEQEHDGILDLGILLVIIPYLHDSDKLIFICNRDTLQESAHTEKNKAYDRLCSGFVSNRLPSQLVVAELVGFLLVLVFLRNLLAIQFQHSRFVNACNENRVFTRSVVIRSSGANRCHELKLPQLQFQQHPHTGASLIVGLNDICQRKNNSTNREDYSKIPRYTERGYFLCSCGHCTTKESAT